MQQHYWLQPAPNKDLSKQLNKGFDKLDKDLENLRRQHQLILNSVGEGVYVLDLMGRATFINPAAARMIGWEVTDLLGKSMHSVLHHSKPDQSPYPAHECPIYLAFRDGKIHSSNTEVFWRRDGSSFPVEYISTPMEDEQGNLLGTVVAFQDITKRKWAEAVLQRTKEELEQKVWERTAELQQANQQLQELSELKSRFVSMVCHEFRNPLHNILLSASSLERYDTQLSPEQRGDYLRGVQRNVERMTQMIDDILVIGKIEAHKLEIRPIELNLVQFCCALVAEMQRDYDYPQLTMTSRSQSLMAELDEKLLRSILTNIVTNSLRYTFNHQPVALQLSKRQGQVIIRISDRGIGIPPEDLPHLFEPFHRGRNVSNIPGTGLGLHIVKQFIDLHQGQIKVDSQLNIGTTFTITLPIHHSHA
ncbi:MAG: PAS domain-containing sensor histidine kinase [Coleofasciculaceae cyanobacterium SM2_1_6]|nr:PAS domain-containing sensor histidine kinase [Coleofasciculaceae cyanobacterium SM2_1_6]